MSLVVLFTMAGFSMPSLPFEFPPMSPETQLDPAILPGQLKELPIEDDEAEEEPSNEAAPLGLTALPA